MRFFIFLYEIQFFIASAPAILCPPSNQMSLVFKECFLTISVLIFSNLPGQYVDLIPLFISFILIPNSGTEVKAVTANTALIT